MFEFVEKFPENTTFSFLSNGNSMLPILRSGDRVFYRKTPFNKIRVNDIVLVRKYRRLLTHRVIYKTDSWIVTKGDNNPVSDGKIRPVQILAKAHYLKRESRRIDLDELYTLQSLLYYNEIDKIITALHKSKVDVLVLKGLPLHLYYEGVRPKRLYFDCDILIPPSQADKAVSVLVKNGYAKINASLSKQHARLKNKQTEDSFHKTIGSFPVVFDLHYEAVFLMTQLGKLDSLYPQHLIDEMTENFLIGKRRVAVEGKQFPLLAPADLILYLMLHFFHHNFKGIHRLALVHNILKKIPDKTALFKKIEANVRNYQVASFVYPGFLLLKKYFSSPVPESFLHAIQPDPSRIRHIRNVISESIFDDQTRIHSGIARFKHLFMLSPHPLWKRLTVFINPAVFYSLLWTMSKRFALRIKP